MVVEMMWRYSILLYSCWIFFLSKCSARSGMDPSSPLSVGDIISSPGEIFELGFFTLDDSMNQFLGIWFRETSPKQVVWVANRKEPIIKGSKASFRLGNYGNLTLSDGQQNVLWSSNTSFRSNGTVAELSDQGNLVLKDNVTGHIHWESFDHLGDSILPGSSLMSNPRTGRNRGCISWKRNSDPSPGDFTFEIIPQTPPETAIWKNSNLHWRSGPWSKQKFTGIEEMDSTYVSAYDLEQNFRDGTVKFLYEVYDNVTEYMRIKPQGSLSLIRKEANNWVVPWEEPQHLCDFYRACGPYAVCRKHESPLCKCLDGFVPKSDSEWKKGNWTNGCVKQREYCHKNMSTKSREKFLAIPGVKLPYHYDFFSSVKNCSEVCLNNCSCIAYASVQGIGCLVWVRELVDIVQFSSRGETLFLRVMNDDSDGNLKLIISLVSVSTVILVAAVAFGYFRWSSSPNDSNHEEKMVLGSKSRSTDLEYNDAMDLHLFDLGTILIATNYFSAVNKLGHGGFGQVYKGTLPDGTEIAVKRLSSNSGQGVEEFKNEATLISKLQHRNLVRVLGCYVDEKEKLVVYEFMLNKSLDTILFDPARKSELDWPTRFNIIEGIAKGLVYLHRDSLFRIIHRDLKASNILLDEKLNPKISDFGLARTFQGTQDLANTLRVVGTLGYMSPEYALSGAYSEKSDIYSFGVLVLEIVTGRRISSFADDEQNHNLTAYAWRSWSEGLEIADSAMEGSVLSPQVERCIHIGLLCVQDFPSDRPTMPQIISALKNEIELPEPKQPFFAFQNRMRPSSPTCSGSNYSMNEVSITKMIGR